MIVLLLFIGGCGQNRESGPVKEVSGEMNNGSVVLTVEPVQKQDEIEFNMSVVNHSDEAVEFEFSSGQKLELIVSDKEGNERYRYSKGKMFTQAFQKMTLQPKETYDFTDVWKEVPEPGAYDVNVTFLGRTEQLGVLRAGKTFEVK
ncbi:Intracellular proteinase inhibitor [Bacillus sonorensis]|uniref:Intracellular proteinase inhibitor Ipi n=2 Tax=Bacillus sonorensis TaxID=119858 RepID=M5P9F3_9BACI|nr:Intracellular proteinase inhibitor [Bacillus sonorensis]EME76079.1 intracellular proteinase inhibitor Ipi [Bacillus sonorensis L12]